MNQELIQRQVGKECVLSSGSYGRTVRGRIVSVVDNWIEVETARGTEILNADYVQYLKIIGRQPRIPAE